MGADLMLATGTTKPHPLIWEAQQGAVAFQVRSRAGLSLASSYAAWGPVLSYTDAGCKVRRSGKTWCRTPGAVGGTGWHEVWFRNAQGVWFGRAVESGRIECADGVNCVVLAAGVK